MMFDLYLPPNYIRSRLDLEQVVRIGSTTENISLDFKAKSVVPDLPKAKKTKAAEELALDICQFANTWGGVLLVGVKEDIDESHGRKVASEYLGYHDFDYLSEFINDSVLPLIHPPSTVTF